MLLEAHANEQNSERSLFIVYMDVYVYHHLVPMLKVLGMKSHSQCVIFQRAASKHIHGEYCEIARHCSACTGS